MTLSIGSSGTVSPTPSGVASAARDDTADVVACCRSGQGLAALLTQPQQERQVAELDMAQLCRALYELQKLLYRDDERPAADPLPLLRLLARRGVALLGDDRETRHRDDRSWKEYGNAFKDAVRLAIVYPELQGCDSWQALELGYLKRALRCNEYQTRGMINDFFQRLTVDELMSISHEMQSFCDVEVLSCLPTKLQEARRGNSDPFALWLKLNPIIEDMRWDTKMKHNFMGELVKQIASLPAERLLAVSEEQLTVFLSTMPLFNTQWTSYQGHLESIIDNLIDCGRALSEREVVLLLFNVDIPKYRDEDKRRWIPPLTDKFIALFADGALPSITSSKKVASALYHQHNNNYCPDKTMEAIRLLIKAVSSNDEPLGTDLKYLISLFMMSTIFKESDQHYLTKLVDAICCCRPQYYRSHERENRTNTINLTQLTFLLPFAHVAIKCYGTKARLYNWAIDNLEQIPLGQCDITKAGVLLSVPTIVKLDAARAEQYHRKVVHKLSNGQWDSGSGRKTQYLELSLVLEAEPPPAVKEVYSKRRSASSRT